MNCHFPLALEFGFSLVRLPPLSHSITEQGGRSPPHLPLSDVVVGAAGSSGTVDGEVGGGVVGEKVLGGVGGTTGIEGKTGVVEPLIWI